MTPESETLVTLELFQGRLVEAHIAQRFELSDYHALLSHTRHLVDQHGLIRMLMQLHRFEDWEKSAQWRDLDFDLSPLAGVEQLAIVGPEHCQPGLSSFLAPFECATTRFFLLSEWMRGREWIDRGLATTRS